MSKGTIMGSVTRERKDMTRLSYWAFSDVTWLTVSVFIIYCAFVIQFMAASLKSQLPRGLERVPPYIARILRSLIEHTRGINTRLTGICVRVLVCRRRPCLSTSTDLQNVTEWKCSKAWTKLCKTKAEPQSQRLITLYGLANIGHKWIPQKEREIFWLTVGIEIPFTSTYSSHFCWYHSF